MGRPMRPGRHAAPDRSFSRSTSSALFRGLALLAAIVVLGIVLLNSSDDGALPVTTPGASLPQTAPAVVDTTLGIQPTVNVEPGDDVTSTTFGGGVSPGGVLRAPAEVKVIVANGTRVQGLAGKVSDKLGAVGFIMAVPTDVTAKPKPTQVVYVVGYENEARDIANRLNIDPSKVTQLGTASPVADAAGAQVIVVVGAELATV